MLTLHYTPLTCSLTTLIALEEAGADYRAVRVDFASNEQRGDAFLKLNPKSRVPALETDQGVVTETPALLTYLAQLYPSARLAPLDDPFAFSRFQAFNAYLCGTVHPAHAHAVRGYRWADDKAAIAEMRRKAPEVIAGCYSVIEQSLLAGPWVMGEQYSGADAYLFNVALWIERDGVDATQFPRVLDHRQQMLERPAVQRAMATGWIPLKA